MSGVVAAASFLTRIPVPGAADARAVAAAVPYYPIVGGAVGAFAGGVGIALAAALPPTLAAAIVVALLAVVTGAMHLDGLADTADAVGGWTRAERLRIMRDHTVGAFGTTALIAVILVEVTAIAALLPIGAPTVLVFVAVFAASRAAAPPLAALMPYAREDEEAPPRFVTHTRALVAVVVAAALSAPAGVRGGAAFAAAAIVAAASALLYRRSLGGITGDTLGATIAVAEALALVAAVAVIP